MKSTEEWTAVLARMERWQAYAWHPPSQDVRPNIKPPFWTVTHPITLSSDEDPRVSVELEGGALLRLDAVTREGSDDVERAWWKERRLLVLNGQLAGRYVRHLASSSERAGGAEGDRFPPAGLEPVDASHAPARGAPSSAGVNIGTEARRFVVTVTQGGRGLPAGTILEEVRRFEEWQHPACIDSQLRTLAAEMRVVDGPHVGPARVGSVVTIELETGWENQEPFPGSRPSWLQSIEPRIRMKGPDLGSVDHVIDEVRDLTYAEAERVERALAIAKAGPAFENCRFQIEVGVRLDCGANVEHEMLEAVRRITDALPGPRGEEPWSSAWEAAVDAACAHIGGFYAHPELSPPLLVAWRARIDQLDLALLGPEPAES